MFRPIDLSGGASIVVRTAGPAATLAQTVEQTARRAAPLVSFAVTPLADGIAQEITALRATAAVVGGLGALALILALFGVGAVTANAVAQRTHEIGVRMALGASATDAVAFVVRQSMRAVIGGAVAGGVVAALLSRALASLLYGLSSVDPVAFASAALFLLVASILAAWLPARGAARVDPLIALRAE
jgi:putative ABC transport system permease protein